MNTNTYSKLVEEVKVKMLGPDGRIDWQFLPQGYICPGDMRNLMFPFVEALYFDDQKQLAEAVLTNVLYWYLDIGRKYRKCCCDQQSEVSGLAATLGFERLRDYAVSIQCPISPAGYRQNPGKGWSSPEKYFDRHRSGYVYRHLQDFVDGRVDLLSK